MAEVTIEATPNGPYLVTGSIELGHGNDSGNKGTLLNPTC
jgi:hypothetical protein